jgi:hypothetical protein
MLSCYPAQTTGVNIMRLDDKIELAIILAVVAIIVSTLLIMKDHTWPI